MNGIIDKMAKGCGDFFVSSGREFTQLANTVNYQTWLALSVLVVVLGFYFLKANR